MYAWLCTFPNFNLYCHLTPLSSLLKCPPLQNLAIYWIFSCPFFRRHIDFTSFFELSEWQHVCFKWENGAGNWELYINGEAVKSGTGYQIGKVPTRLSALFSTCLVCNFISIHRSTCQFFAIHKCKLNHYPADNLVCFVNTYPLDSDLSAG